MNINYQKWLNKTKIFDKKEKSTFAYWFAHWKCYNLVAMQLGIWKFKYLFHDIEKPFLKLFLTYEKVRKFHRTYHKHHLNYRKPHKIDWIAVAIDWECGQYSKMDSPWNARGFVYDYIRRNPQWKDRLLNEMLPILDKIGIKTITNRDVDDPFWIAEKLKLADF